MGTKILTCFNLYGLSKKIKVLCFNSFECFMGYLFFLLCDLHDFHLFLDSIILLLKAKKDKILFDYCAQKK